jgi:hypothetical protein
MPVDDERVWNEEVEVCLDITLLFDDLRKDENSPNRDSNPFVPG